MDQEKLSETSIQPLETDKHKAKKYLLRVAYAVIGLIAFYLWLHQGEANVGNVVFVPIPIMVGLYIVFQISHAIYYTFKPWMDKRPANTKPLWTVLIMAGFWIIVLIVLHYLFFGYAQVFSYAVISLMIIITSIYIAFSHKK